MRTGYRLVGFGLALVLAVSPVVGGDLKDLYFGEALFHAKQGQFFDAIQRLDYNATMATTLIIAFVFVLMNLVVDVLYLFLDPRISYT